MNTVMEVLPGMKGIDVAYHYPTGASIRAAGYDFAVIYDSPNTLKNATDATVDDYLTNGLGVWHVYEINKDRTLLGRQAGRTDAQAFNKTLTRRGVPENVAGIFANDTNTTAGNVNSQTAYMQGAYSLFSWDMGGYQDIDLTAAASPTVQFDLLWLPNAWAWDHPNPKLKSVAIQEATDLGYHMIQGRLSDDTTEPSYDMMEGIAVDINHCIRACLSWGAPRTKENDMLPVITNTEPYTLGATTWNPGMVKWCLGTVKRHLEEGEWVNVYKSDPGIGLSNADLVAIPDYVGPTNLSGATIITQSTSVVQ